MASSGCDGRRRFTGQKDRACRGMHEGRRRSRGQEICIGFSMECRRHGGGVSEVWAGSTVVGCRAGDGNEIGKGETQRIYGERERKN